MKLQIEDPNKILDKTFICWLIIEIRKKIIKELNSGKLANWTNFLNDQNLYKSIYKKKIDAQEMVLIGVTNLEYFTSESNYIIQINPNIYVPGLDRVKVNTICKLINFGNVELVGYPIFTETFNEVAENISTYVRQYFQGIL